MRKLMELRQIIALAESAIDGVGKTPPKQNNRLLFGLQTGCRPARVKVVSSKGREYVYAKGRGWMLPLNGKNPSAFERSYSRAIKIIDWVESHPATVRDLVRLYEKSSAYARLSPPVQTGYTRVLIRLVDVCGSAAVLDLSAGDIETASAGTKGARTHSIKVINAMLNWARSMGRVPEWFDPANGLISKRKEGETVYFIQAGENGPIKIGRAKDAATRLMLLQSGNHLPLFLRASVVTASSVSVEGRYHRDFAEHRIRGEWFAPHEDILAEIAHLSHRITERNERG